MFRGEKNTQWEGGYRVPAMIRWPVSSSPAPVVNEIGAHEDMLTTLVAAAGDKTAKEDLLKGRTIAGRTYKVHLDGYDLGPASRATPHGRAMSSSTGPTTAAWPRLRYNDVKITFLKQEAEGLKVWQQPFTPLRAPAITNLRMDPFERAEEENAMGYQRWYIGRACSPLRQRRVCRPVAAELQGLPAAPEPGSFNLDRVMEAVSGGAQKHAN